VTHVGRLVWQRCVAGVGTGLLLAVSVARADPAADYALNCRGCHGPDGASTPGGAPSFRGEVGKFLGVPGGRAYLVRVPGTAQSELDDARTAALLNWLVRAFSPAQVPADFAPYTAAEVARYRHTPLTDVDAVRRELVRQFE
jgi:mono/diheme cytochrome c family protein